MLLRWKTILTTLTITVIITHNAINHVYSSYTDFISHNYITSKQSVNINSQSIKSNVLSQPKDKSPIHSTQQSNQTQNSHTLNKLSTQVLPPIKIIKEKIGIKKSEESFDQNEVNGNQQEQGSTGVDKSKESEDSIIDSTELQKQNNIIDFKPTIQFKPTKVSDTTEDNIITCTTPPPIPAGPRYPIQYPNTNTLISNCTLINQHTNITDQITTEEDTAYISITNNIEDNSLSNQKEDLFSTEYNSFFVNNLTYKSLDQQESKSLLGTTSTSTATALNQSSDSRKPTSVKLVELDINSKTSTEQYTYTKSVYIDIYQPKQGYIFNKINSGQLLIWQTKDPKKYVIKAVLYRINYCKSTLTLTLSDRTTKNFKLNIKPKSEIQLIKVEFFTDLDIDIKKSCNQYNYSESNKVGTYEAQESFGFNKVYEKKSWYNFTGSDKLVWEATESMYGIKVLIHWVNESVKIVSITLCDGNTKDFKLTNKSANSTDVTPIKHTNPMIDVDDQGNQIETVELDVNTKKSNDKYNYSISNNIHTYEPKLGYGFNRVKNGTNKVWETSDSSQYVINVVILQDPYEHLKAITLTLSDGSVKIYYKPNENSSWTELDKLNKGIELDVSKKQSTKEYLYDNSDYVGIYQPKLGYAFKKITSSGTNIWESNDKRYAIKVVIHGLNCRNKIMTITLSDLNTIKFHRLDRDKPWTIVKVNKVKMGIELDINSKTSTEQYTYSESNNVGIFTPRKGYGFNKLTTSYSIGGLMRFTKSSLHHDIIWVTKYPQRYVNKVVIYWVDEKVKNVSITLSNGSIITYKIILRYS